MSNINFTSNISLKEIVKRMKTFSETNTIFDREELHFEYIGEYKAFNEILEDIDVLNENEFTKKYVRIVNDLSNDFENRITTDQNMINELSGYNNVIINVLELLNPELKYEVGFLKYIETIETTKV